MEEIDAELRRWVEEQNFSGIVLVRSGADVVLEGCYGLANRTDGVPVRPGTRFGLASVTKMFTATAVATLVEEGSLAFDARVVDCLPPDKRPTTLSPDVTVHHLLTHTSGIADYYEEEDAVTWDDYADLWSDRPTYRIRTPADFLPLFADRPARFAPGERFAYSNAGYILLGLVIEEAAGTSYIDAVTTRVLRPAGMQSSGFFSFDEVHADMAIGYRPPRTEGAPWRTNVFSIPAVGGPDGGACATAGDLARFLEMLDAGALLSEGMRDVVLTPHAHDDADRFYGYGVWLIGHRGDRTVRFGHGGDDPGFEAMILRFPALDITMVALCNVNELIGDIRDLLVKHILRDV